MKSRTFEPSTSKNRVLLVAQQEDDFMTNSPQSSKANGPWNVVQRLLYGLLLRAGLLISGAFLIFEILKALLAWSEHSE